MSADSAQFLQQISSRFFQDYRKKKKNFDIILRTKDNGRFPAHRILLASVSGYFAALFKYCSCCEEGLDDKSKEGRQLLTTRSDVEPTLDREDQSELLGDNSKTKEYTLPDNILKDSFNIILEWVYTESLNFMSRTALLQHLTYVITDADFLGIPELVCASQCLIMQQATVDEFVDIWNYANAFLLTELQEQILNYILLLFEDISLLEANGRKILTNLKMEELVMILKSDDLNVADELTVFMVIIEYVKKNNVENHLPDLLTLVRAGLLNLDDFENKIANNYLVKNNELCSRFIDDVREHFHQVMTTSIEVALPTPFFCRPRNPSHLIFVFCGWSDLEPTQILECYDMRSDKWSFCYNLSSTTPRAYMGTEIIGKSAFIMGGYSNERYLNSTELLNLETGDVTIGPPMNEMRCYVSTAKVNDYVYALGGNSGNERLNSVERYDPLQNQWRSVASMEFVRSDAGGTVCGGLIYMVGGFNGHDVLNTAEVYDPETDAWRRIANMNSRRSGTRAVSHGKNVFALGGFSGTSRLRTCERYNTENNTWSYIPPMTITRSNFDAVVVGDNILVVGGYDGISTTSSCEYFALKNYVWRPFSPLNLNRSALSLCLVDSSILINKHLYFYQNKDNFIQETRNISSPMNYSRRSFSSESLMDSDDDSLNDLIDLFGEDN